LFDLICVYCVCLAVGWAEAGNRSGVGLYDRCHRGLPSPFANTLEELKGSMGNVHARKQSQALKE